MKSLRSLALFVAVLLAVGGSAWAVGYLEPNMGAVYPQFLNSAVVVVDTQVKATPGFLQCIMMSQSDAAPQAGTITIYDNTAESGTVVFAHTFTTATFMPVQICPQRVMATGIYIGYSATTDVNTSVSYR